MTSKDNVKCKFCNWKGKRSELEVEMDESISLPSGKETGRLICPRCEEPVEGNFKSVDYLRSWFNTHEGMFDPDTIINEVVGVMNDDIVLSYKKEGVIALIEQCGGNETSVAFLKEHLDEVIEHLQKDEYLHEEMDEAMKKSIWTCLEELKGI